MTRDEVATAIIRGQWRTARQEETRRLLARAVFEGVTRELGEGPTDRWIERAAVIAAAGFAPAADASNPYS